LTSGARDVNITDMQQNINNSTEGADIMETMTQEKMQEIYTNKKLRNSVAYAHVCCNSSGEETHKKALHWPDSYKVTPEQITEAKKELSRSQAETHKKYKNSLLFVGMGMTYETKTDIGNHRIRTEFKNSKGKQYFVEFGTACNHAYTRCDHSIDRQAEEGKYGYNNYMDLEKNGLGRYTPKYILDLVNSTFDCKFTEIFIDNYDLSCDGVMCESPK